MARKEVVSLVIELVSITVSAALIFVEPGRTRTTLEVINDLCQVAQRIIEVIQRMIQRDEDEAAQSFPID